MMDLSLIPDGGLAWLDASGPLSNVVLSTRIRLARNLAGAAFVGRAKPADRRRVLEQVDAAWAGSEAARGGVRFLLDEMTAEERRRQVLPPRPSKRRLTSPSV